MTDSKIEWTEKTWEPTAGCSRVSEGCRNCYAEKFVGTRFYGMAERRARDGVANGSTIDVSLKVINPKTKKWNGHIELLEMNLDQPIKRKKPTVYFVNSRSDLFHPKVPFEYIDRVFAVMALCPQHRFQVLTKRPERMADYYMRNKGEGWVSVAHEVLSINPNPPESNGDYDGPMKNVWLGTSVEHQEAADERIPHLLACPAIGRFLSVEPLLGAVDLKEWLYTDDLVTCPKCNYTGPDDYFDCCGADDGNLFCNKCGIEFEPGTPHSIGWVIVGGESGAEADIRGCGIEWIRSIIKQCKDAGVPVFVKQLGGRVYAPYKEEECEGYAQRLKLNHPKGGDMSEWPADQQMKTIDRITGDLAYNRAIGTEMAAELAAERAKVERLREALTPTNSPHSI